MFQSPGSLAPPHTPQGNPISLLRNETAGGNAVPSSPGPDQFLQAQGQNCLCRAALMLLLPQVADAMRERRLDEVFRVTGAVMTGCQTIVDCSTCRITCTDLLLMATVLQETHPCFDFIAKSQLDGTVRVGFGGYEVMSNNTMLRAMLVTDLVQKTDTVLKGISSKAQSMLDRYRPDELAGEMCQLAQANIAYLESSINTMKGILRCVMTYVADFHGSGTAAPMGDSEAALPGS